MTSACGVVEKDPSSSTIVGASGYTAMDLIRGQKGFSDMALLSMTTGDEDFPFLVNADAVKRYFVKRDPLDEKNKRVQAKMGIPANQEKEKGSGKS